LKYKNVNVLFEDSIGYLWVGTKTGLYRYDGNNITSFQQNVFNSNSIPNNNINSIVEDKNNNLWIGSESYLIYYNRSKNTFKGYYKNKTVTVFDTSSKNENIWAYLNNVGLIEINSTDIENIKIQEVNKNIPFINNITASNFLLDDFNRKWLGTPKGIYILKNRKNVRTNFNKKVNAIKLYDNNRIIAITDNDLYILGYNKEDSNLEILEVYKNFTTSFTTNASLTSLAISPNNSDLWLGSTNGLFRAVRKNNTYSFVYFSKTLEKGSLNHAQIKSTIFDSYGNLWIGSLKGINKYLGEKTIFSFNRVNQSADSYNLRTQSIVNYSDNNILLGTNDGLYLYNNKNGYSRINTSISNINIVCQNYEKDKLIIGNENTLYISTDFHLEQKGITLSKIKSYTKNITDIATLNKNEIWLGLWDGGIDIINTENQISKFKKRVIQKLKNYHVFVFLLTKNNELWIGTRGILENLMNLHLIQSPQSKRIKTIIYG